MGLSCSCLEFDGEGVFFYAPTDFQTMPFFSRRKKCCSCKDVIKTGDSVAIFDRRRTINFSSKYEMSRFGEDAEINMGNWYLCERCSEIYFNLDDLGFCVNPQDNMNELLEHYRNIKENPA